jgi:hypothetical protein
MVLPVTGCVVDKLTGQARLEQSVTVHSPVSWKPTSNHVPGERDSLADVHKFL